MKLSQEKKVSLLKAIGIFLFYLIYTSLFSTLFSTFGFEDEIFIRFIADLVFLFLILYLYRKNIKKDFQTFKKKYSLKQSILTILKWVILLFVINILVTGIGGMFLDSSTLDENTTAIYSLFEVSTIYTIFKTLIFASIAEELLFKESLRSVISNDALFLLVSTFLYAFMNIAYADWNLNVVLLDFLSYASFSLVLGIAYLRNKSNIMIPIFVKFVYNLIPTTLLILTAVGVIQ